MAQNSYSAYLTQKSPERFMVPLRFSLLYQVQQIWKIIAVQDSEKFASGISVTL